MNIIRIRYVCLDVSGGAARGNDPIDDLSAKFGAPRGYNDVCAMFGGYFGSSATDTRTGAGDDDTFAVEDLA